MKKKLVGLMILCAGLSVAQVRPERAYGACYWTSEGNGFSEISCKLETLPDTNDGRKRYRVLFQPQQHLVFIPEDTPRQLVPGKFATIMWGIMDHPDLGGAFWVGDPAWGSLTIVPVDPTTKLFLAEQAANGRLQKNTMAFLTVRQDVDSNGAPVKGVFSFEVTEAASTSMFTLRSMPNPKVQEFIRKAELR